MEFSPKRVQRTYGPPLRSYLVAKLYPIPSRVEFASIFEILLAAIDADGYGKDFENDVFYMHPYCWCGHNECKLCAEEPTAYNFYHKASDIGLNWYKYPMRSAETTEELTVERFRELINDCVDSIPLATRVALAGSAFVDIPQVWQSEGKRNSVCGIVASSRYTLLWSTTANVDYGTLAGAGGGKAPSNREIVQYLDEALRKGITLKNGGEVT